MWSTSFSFRHFIHFSYIKTTVFTVGHVLIATLYSVILKLSQLYRSDFVLEFLLRTFTICALFIFSFLLIFSSVLPCSNLDTDKLSGWWESYLCRDTVHTFSFVSFLIHIFKWSPQKLESDSKTLQAVLHSCWKTDVSSHVAVFVFLFILKMHVYFRWPE